MPRTAGRSGRIAGDQLFGSVSEGPLVALRVGVAFFVLVLTNFIMTVAAITISLPVALVVAKRLPAASIFSCFRRPSALVCRAACWLEQFPIPSLRFQVVQPRRASHVRDPAEFEYDGSIEF